MVAPDNDPSNVNQYSGYDDPTGTPTPVKTTGEVIDRRIQEEIVATREGRGEHTDSSDTSGTGE